MHEKQIIQEQKYTSSHPKLYWAPSQKRLYNNFYHQNTEAGQLSLFKLMGCFNPYIPNRKQGVSVTLTSIQTLKDISEKSRDKATKGNGGYIPEIHGDSSLKGWAQTPISASSSCIPTVDKRTPATPFPTAVINLILLSYSSTSTFPNPVCPPLPQPSRSLLSSPTLTKISGQFSSSS